MTGPAVAYLDWGRWVAQCPAAPCTNARELAPGQQTYTCAPPPPHGGCGASAPVQWPDDVAAIKASVAGLPQSQQEWKPLADTDEETS